jgi:hypothetical protein
LLTKAFSFLVMSKAFPEEEEEEEEEEDQFIGKV